MDNISDKNISSTMDSNDTKTNINKANTELALISHTDKNFIFLYQKIKKISAALYLLTNFFEETEPLKASIRGGATSFLSMNARMHKASTYQLKELQPHFESKILEVISLLDVASLNGLISPGNLSILKKEFEDIIGYFGKIIEEKRGDTVALDSSFFIPDEASREYLSKQNISAQNVLNNLSKDKDEHSDLYKRKISFTHNEDEELEYSEEKKEKLKDFGSVAVKKNRRQSLIISLLKRKKEVMIKDIVGLITDCSEKTIQRELAVLVETGLLKKEGERRWTKYTLA